MRALEASQVRDVVGCEDVKSSRVRFSRTGQFSASCAHSSEGCAQSHVYGTPTFGLARSGSCPCCVPESCASARGCRCQLLLLSSPPGFLCPLAFHTDDRLKVGSCRRAVCPTGSLACRCSLQPPAFSGRQLFSFAWTFPVSIIRGRAVAKALGQPRFLLPLCCSCSPATAPRLRSGQLGYPSTPSSRQDPNDDFGHEG